MVCIAKYFLEANVFSSPPPSNFSLTHHPLLLLCAGTNMMLQPKMDVLSSALDEFLGKLEPMEGDYAVLKSVCVNLSPQFTLLVAFFFVGHSTANF